MANENKNEYPLAFEPLEKSTYVDDVLFGAATKENAIHIRNRVTETLKQGGFDLRKWSASSLDLLPNADDVPDPLYIEPEDKLHKKVLEVLWFPKTDVFLVQTGEVDNSVLTKRTILSHVSRIFDPLGWLFPFTIRAKLVMRILWILKTN